MSDVASSVAISCGRVPELVEQGDEFIVAPVHISDDVEGSVVAPSVDPQRLANDRRCLHGLDRIKDVDVTESLALETPHRALHLVSLAVNHAGWQVPIGSASISLDTQLLREIEDDRHGQAVVFAAQGDKRLARLGLNACGVDNDDSPGTQALSGNRMQHAKSRSGGSEVVLVIGHEGATEVGRDHLSRAK